MKIKFIKEYRAIPLSGGIDNDWGCYKDEVKDTHDDQGQWLIDNGFAEEVKESGWWKPKYGEKYYFVSNIGSVQLDPWGNDELDEARYSMGNCFKTKDAAERYRDYLRAIATVRQDEGVLTLEEAAKNGYIYYICIHNEFGLVVHGFNADYISVNTILFDTREHAQASRDKHPDEWKIIANYDWSRE